MQLPAAQTSLEPHPRREDRRGRKPFMSQNVHQGRRQPINERAPPVQRPSIPAPGLPTTRAKQVAEYGRSVFLLVAVGAGVMSAPRPC